MFADARMIRQSGDNPIRKPCGWIRIGRAETSAIGWAKDPLEDQVDPLEMIIEVE